MERLAVAMIWIGFGAFVIPKFVKDVLDDISSRRRRVSPVDVVCLGTVIVSWLGGLFIISIF